MLQKVVDYFHEGDKVLDKKGSKKYQLNSLSFCTVHSSKLYSRHVHVHVTPVGSVLHVVFTTARERKQMNPLYAKWVKLRRQLQR